MSALKLVVHFVAQEQLIQRQLVLADDGELSDVELAPTSNTEPCTLYV